MAFFIKTIKRFLGSLATIADIQRFGEWKEKLEDALEELEKTHKGKKMTKKEYLNRKKILKEKLKKAEELVEKSEKRKEEFTKIDIKI